jgi:hypothetical protein
MSYDPNHPVSSTTGKAEPSHAIWWIVKAPLNVMMVEAGSVEQAKEKALALAKLAHKPYLADGWEARPSTAEERRIYAHLMDATKRPSEPTLRTAKRKTKSAKDRLL